MEIFFFFGFHSVVRSILVAMTVAIILPMIYTYGIAVTYTLCAILIWVSYRYVKSFPPKEIDFLFNEHL